MADSTIPAPEKQLTRFEAQKRLGLFATHDYAMLFLIAATILTMVAYAVFGKPTLGYLLLGCCVVLFWMLLWLVVLVYRALVFILDLHADVALMPEAAARIAAGYFEGRVPPKR